MILLSLPVSVFADLMESEFAGTFQQRDHQETSFSNSNAYQKIWDTNTLIDEERFDEALLELTKLLDGPLSDYEKAACQQMAAYVNAIMENVPAAIALYEESLTSVALPPVSHQGTLYSLASLYASEQKYQQAIDKMREWFFFEKEPFADAYMLVGSWFAALGNNDEALPFILRAIEKSATPYEGWYALAVAIHIEKEEYIETVPLLKAMLSYWPRTSKTWDMLTGVYMELGEEKAALDTTMAAYNSGMLRDPQRILSLVELNLYHEIPFAGASILENEMFAGVVPETDENLQLLMQAWILAREYGRAVTAIEKLVEAANDPGYWLEASRLQMVDGGWQAAADSAERAIAAGVEKIAEAHLLRGMALVELDKFDESLQHFQKVAEIGTDEEKRRASMWARYAERAGQHVELLVAK